MRSVCRVDKVPWIFRNAKRNVFSCVLNTKTKRTGAEVKRTGAKVKRTGAEYFLVDSLAEIFPTEHFRDTMLQWEYF